MLNAYNYILEKRATTAALEAQSKMYATCPTFNSDEMKQIAKKFTENGTNLYEVEADLVQKIENRQFRL